MSFSPAFLVHLIIFTISAFLAFSQFSFLVKIKSLELRFFNIGLRYFSASLLKKVVLDLPLLACSAGILTTILLCEKSSCLTLILISSPILIPLDIWQR